ncbi:MAG TPA: ice-binding family protein [Usitatibacter sp.]|nr:ice-binding family protein [Usitatibacter sp.]
MKIIQIVRAIASATIALIVTAPAAWAQNVSLGTASQFAVLGGSAVTNTGATVVTGSVGVSPGTAITGFPPGSIVPGSGLLHSANAVAAQAQADLTTAYNDAATRPCGTVIAGGTLGGLTLTPGVYCGAASLTGVLTLNGAGVYIFQFPSTFVTASGSSVALINGAQACGVTYQVTSSATLGTGSNISGNILALTSITLTTGANLNGRTLARNGAVTLDTNTVTACSGGPVPPVPPIVPVAPGGPAQAVPTLSEWAMILLAALMAATAFVAMRKRS